jgi:hypothetical protein
MNNGWDEHLHIVLYDYQTSLKVTIGPTPFQLMYGLHPLVLTKCLLPTKSLFKY